MDIKQLYRQVIMDHYKSPRNKGLTDEKGYKMFHMNNPSCGDDISVCALVENNIIKDIKQSGTGCSICCASASIMTISLIGKTVVEARKFNDEFYRMVMGQTYNDSILNTDAIVFQSISQFPARIKCATLAWKALDEIIDEDKK